MPRAKHASCRKDRRTRDRKSTRLNSSHVAISHAVFGLKKKTIEGFAMANPNLHLVVVASGLRSNLQALLVAIDAGQLTHRIIVVVCSHHDLQAVHLPLR